MARFFIELNVHIEDVVQEAQRHDRAAPLQIRRALERDRQVVDLRRVLADLQDDLLALGIGLDRLGRVLPIHLAACLLEQVPERRHRHTVIHARVDVEIDEFVGSWLTFEPSDRSRLGRSNSALGVNLSIGGSIFSVQDKIRIRIFTKDMAQYRRFLPTGDLCEPLADAVFFYIGDQLDWETELAIPAGAVEASKLGSFGQIGWTSWMSPGSILMPKRGSIRSSRTA